MIEKILLVLVTILLVLLAIGALLTVSIRALDLILAAVDRVPLYVMIPGSILLFFIIYAVFN